MIDPTAAFQYSLGVSIIHLALGVVIQMVKRPDMAKVGDDPACLQEAEAYNMIIDLYFSCHCIAFLACGYRELYSTNTMLLAQFMRMVEIFSTPFYMGCILFSLEKTSMILVREYTTDPVADMPSVQTVDENSLKSTLFLYDKCSRSDFHRFQGHSFEWLLIESSIYFYYLMTMVIIMIKSRFINVGMDNTEQFEPIRLSMVANKISSHIEIKKKAEEYYIDKERMILVEGISLKICLNQQHFEQIKGVKENQPI